MTTKKDGFTLVELMLAMAFLSFLLLFIVSAVMQATRLYVKGQAISSINQTARQVSDDLVKQIRYSKPTTAGGNRLCVGGTTYVWNVEGTSANKFSGSDASTPLRLVQFQDTTAAYCSAYATSDIPKSGTRDLIGPDVTVLAFSITNPTGRLWNISLILSTSGSNVANPSPSSPTGFACDATNEFCAFGDFSTNVYYRGNQ